MPLFAVHYRYVDDTALVSSHRPVHRRYLSERADAGELVLAGPLSGPGDPGGLLILNVGSRERAIEITSEDPFFSCGVVAECTVRGWTLSIGGELLPRT